MTSWNQEDPNSQTLEDTAQHQGRSGLVRFALKYTLVFHRNEPKIFYLKYFTMKTCAVSPKEP